MRGARSFKSGWLSTISTIHANSSGRGRSVPITEAADASEQLRLLEGGAVAAADDSSSSSALRSTVGDGGLLRQRGGVSARGSPPPASSSAGGGDATASTSLGGLPSRRDWREKRKTRLVCAQRFSRFFFVLGSIVTLVLVAYASSRITSAQSGRVAAIARLRLYCVSAAAARPEAHCTRLSNEALWDEMTMALSKVYRKPVDDIRDLSLENVVALGDAELFDSARLFLIANGIIDANEVHTVDQVRKRAVLALAVRSKMRSSHLYALSSAELDVQLRAQLLRGAEDEAGPAPTPKEPPLERV